MSKIRIIQIGATSENIGGVAQQIKNIINTNHKNLVFYNLTKYKKKNLNDFDIKYSALNILPRLLFLKNFLIKKKVKFIHAHTQRAGFLIFLLSLVTLKFNFFYSPHGLRFTQTKNLKRIFHFFIDYLIALRADKIICITRTEKLFFDKISKKTIIISNYIKIPKIKKKNKKNQILMVGNIDCIKQPKLFINIAIEVLKNYSFMKFIWIGKGNKAEIKKLNQYHKNIEFIGYKSHKKTLEIMNESLLLLFTSKFETFSTSIAEASALGLKIVSNDFDGILEFKKIKIDIFKKNNIDQGTSKVIKALQNKQKPKCFFIGNTWSNFKQRYEKIYLNKKFAKIKFY